MASAIEDYRRMALMRRTLEKLLLILLVGSMGPSLGAQEVAITPYLGMGPAINGFSAAVGVRLEVHGAWGGYVRGALRGVTNGCEDSLPPTCNYPEGHTQEYAAGIMYSFLSNVAWRGRGGVGVGFLSWQGERDPFVEFNGEMRRTLTSRLELVFGVHGVVAPGVERERSGLQTIVPRKTVFFPNAIAGFAVQLDQL